MNGIESSLGLTGEYTLVKRNAKGEVIQTAKFDNLITNAGLNRLGTAGALIYMFVGTGTNTPTVGDTKMGAYLASAPAGTGDAGPAPVAPLYFSALNLAARFDAGAATGNLTEVGIGWDDADTGVVADDHRVFSRARILDGGGAPTTITVLADEVLDIVYTLRAYPKLTDETYSVTIGGVSYDVVARAAYATSGSFGSPGYPAEGPYVYNVYDGALGTIEEIPDGTVASAGPDVVDLPYSNNSYKLSAESTMPLDSGNVPGGIKSMVVSVGRGASIFSYYSQLQFTPNIPKDNTKVLKLQFSYTWARRP